MSSTKLTSDRLPPAGAGFVWAMSSTTTVLRPHAEMSVAAFTTRIGGVRAAPYDSLDLSWPKPNGQTYSDDAAHESDWVVENRTIAGKAVGSTWRWSRVNQVHGCTVLRAAEPTVRCDADGLWTDDPSDTLAVFTADCVPILLEGARGIAVVHAGWRGLVAGIVAEAALIIGADSMFAGPAIGPCCFEVGTEVSGLFRDSFGGSSVSDERHVDLWEACLAAGEASGISATHVARMCTFCNPELFFSHRRDNGVTGRQGLLARLA